ncbi:MAG: hypothetical protein H0T76_10745, partial [Nannocystis sp.]
MQASSPMIAALLADRVVLHAAVLASPSEDPPSATHADGAGALLDAVLDALADEPAVGSDALERLFGGRALADAIDEVFGGLAAIRRLLARKMQ